MACVDIVEDTREDITRFMSDSYIWRRWGQEEEEEECRGGPDPQHLEAVAQYPANICAYGLSGYVSVCAG